MVSLQLGHLARGSAGGAHVAAHMRVAVRVHLHRAELELQPSRVRVVVAGTERLEQDPQELVPPTRTLAKRRGGGGGMFAVHQHVCRLLIVA